MSNFSKPLTTSVIQLKQLYIIIYNAVFGMVALFKNSHFSCFSWIKALHSENLKLEKSCAKLDSWLKTIEKDRIRGRQTRSPPFSLFFASQTKGRAVGFEADNCHRDKKS